MRDRYYSNRRCVGSWVESPADGAARRRWQSHCLARAPGCSAWSTLSVSPAGRGRSGSALQPQGRSSTSVHSASRCLGPARWMVTRSPSALTTWNQPSPRRRLAYHRQQSSVNGYNHGKDDNERRTRTDRGPCSRWQRKSYALVEWQVPPSEAERARRLSHRHPAQTKKRIQKAYLRGSSV